MMSTNILDVPMVANDINAATIGEYLVRMLREVWVKDECFSGKRPFGNSGWRVDIYASLIKAGVIAGKLNCEDELEDIHETEEVKADQIISQAIMTMYVPQKGVTL